LQYILKICIGIGIANTFSSIGKPDFYPYQYRYRFGTHNYTTELWLRVVQFKTFGPDLPLLFKMHEIWSDDSQENY